MKAGCFHDCRHDASATLGGYDAVDVTGLTEYDYYTEEEYGFFRLKSK